MAQDGDSPFGKSLMEDINQAQAILIFRDRLVLAIQRRLDPSSGMPEDTWREWGEWRPIPPPHSSGVFNPSPRKIAELAADVVLDVLTRAGGWKM